MLIRVVVQSSYLIKICRYPDDDSLGHQSCDEERFVSFDLSVQTNHHLEVSTNKHSEHVALTSSRLVENLTHLWSGLGFPFFLMLLAVVSLKCSRPSVTLVIFPL